jgi:uncharacterized membrane protein YdjX (TVP38/TMEM64 family)
MNPPSRAQKFEITAAYRAAAEHNGSPDGEWSVPTGDATKPAHLTGEDGMSGRDATKEGRVRSAARLLPLLALLVGLGLFFAFGLEDQLSCAALRDNRAWLGEWVAAHRLLAALGFMAIYASAVALSVPGAAILTVAAGFLFGIPAGTAMVVAAATAGSTLLFLAARTVFRDLLQPRVGRWLARLQRGFAENELSYLLFLRLVPLFPFFVVNLVPAFLGVHLRSFVIATFFGIIPGSFVFASVGAGLGSLFDAGRDCSLDSALTPQIILSLVGLALLALVPVLYKRFWTRRQS